MVGDDGNGLTVMPAVIVFGKGQGAVGVAGLVGHGSAADAAHFTAV